MTFLFECALTSNISRVALTCPPSGHKLNLYIFGFNWISFGETSQGVSRYVVS